SSESYRNRENSLNEAARAKFQNEEYVYVADFSNDHVILVKADGPWQFPYTTENGKITLAETGVKVQRRESWVSSMTNLAANFLKFFKPQASPPETTKEGDEMPMTQEERAALVKETTVAVNEALSPVVTKAIADAVGPLTEALGTLKANQDALTEKLTANSRREETEMREAVKAKYGELVANSLSGDALVEMFKTCGAPAAALAGNAATQPAGDAFNPADFPKE
ncbi:hypothetical protein, partial [Streptococcus salivarius]|uniref:hypothetical protein n=1 Tax=Streptococcus salivarius TaxID=1304 RepID=UPI001C3F1F25